MDDLQQVDWLVRFSPGDHWLKPVLKRGFGHVSLIREWGPLWVLVDPSVSYTQIQIVPREDYELSELVGDDVVVSYVGFVEPRYRWAGPFTCVETVKGFLGISAPVFTPFQLWRYIDGQNA